MSIRNLLITLTVFFAGASSVTAQQPVRRAAEVEQEEQASDPYLPNAHNNQLTSPGYRYNGKALRSSATASSTITTVQVNIDPWGNNIIDDAGNEPNIALNPANPSQLVIGWRQFDNVMSSFRQAGMAYSNDGGLTWTNPGVVLEQGIFRSDPVLDYDTTGTIYYNSLSHDALGNYICKVFRSNTGGAAWDLGTDAAGGDKQWMTIDRTAGVGSGHIYSAWSPFYTSCWPDNFTRSTDGGSTYDPCSNAEGGAYWGTMAVGMNGELYICGADSLTDSLIVSKSLDAIHATFTPSWLPPVKVFMNGFLGFYPTVNPEGLLGQTSIDIDRSNGPGSGNVYMVASVTDFMFTEPGDVMFVKSTDGGQTWSSPRVINTDSSSTTQWFGTMACAPNGRIDVIWLDNSEDFTGTDSSMLRYSYSTDQGSSWSTPEILSPKFDPHVGYPNQLKMGDYFDMISENNGVHLAWANTLNGEEDVYYSYIVPGIVQSVNEYEQEPLLQLSPNPTPGIFSIVSSVNLSLVEVSNSLGQCVFERTPMSSNMLIDLSGAPNGMYLVRMKTSTGAQFMRRIMKAE